jgi:ATP-dependent Lhr-like helicase
MYEGDAPLAERRAAALALDRDLLRDLLGDDELRSLIDPAVLLALEDDLQRRSEGHRARDVDEVADLLRLLGPLSLDELADRTDADELLARAGVGLAAAVDRLVEERRAIAVNVAGDDRLADAADAARLRDALGVAIPLGLPTTFTDPVDHPLRDLVERYARTHGPFTAAEVAARLGVGHEPVRLVLGELEGIDRLVHGEFRPDGVDREWCDPEVVRQLRRRTLAALRREVEPVDAAVLGRFLPAWQGVGSSRRGTDALIDVVAQLQGAPLVASALESEVLPARLAEYRPADLDGLCTSGDVVWVGAGGIGANDGRLRLCFRDQARLLVPPAGDDAPSDPHHAAIRAHLEARGASFWPDLLGAVAATDLPYDEPTVLAALWDLVWAGEVTNDSLGPLRARLGSKASGGRGGKARPGRLARQGPPAAAGRWSLVAPMLTPPPSPTEVAHATATQLLDRYGVLTREMALAEGIAAGFAGVYPVLKALEEQGRVRRGYFVSGLGAAQFAHPGAVDRLRGEREPGDAVVVLAATDTAQPYGAALPWPDSDGRPARAAGARVVLADGAAIGYLERGGRSVLTFRRGGRDGDQSAAGSAGEDRADDVADLVGALCDLARRQPRMELATVDGHPVSDTVLGVALQAAGWRVSYRGLRPPPAR